MSRRREAQKREVIPDPVYKSELLARFINSVMSHGKKSVAESIVYGALDKVQERLGSKMQAMVHSKKEEDESDAAGAGGKQIVLQIFDKALDNVRPSVEVRARRVGGS